MTYILSLALSISLVPALCVMAVDDDGSQTAPPAANAPVKIAEPDVATEAKSDVDVVLERLESAANDLRDFQGNLRYDKLDPVTGRWEIRAGKLLYEVDKDTNTKRFAMLFETQIVGTRKTDRSQRFVYADGWLAEIDDDKKQFIKRQIVPPGKDFDPFRIGDGPFPLPIGQAREEVQAHFEVTLLEKPEASQLADLENVQGIRLIPKPGMPEAEDFERIDIFYDNATNLPVGIELIEVAGNTGEKKKVVRLRELKRNEGIDPAKLSIEEPNPADGWSVSIEPWRNQE